MNLSITIFLNNLAKKSYPLNMDKKTWSYFHKIVNQIKEPERVELIEQISKSTRISENKLYQFIKTVKTNPEKMEAIRKKYNIKLHSKFQEERTAYENKAVKLLPAIKELFISEEKWQQMTLRFVCANRERITLPYLLAEIDQLLDTNKSVSNFNRRKLPKRHCQRSVITKQQLKTKVKRSRRRLYFDKNEHNPFVMDPKGIDELSKTTLAMLGVQFKNLQPKSPEKGYSQVLFTPNKSKVRAYFSKNRNPLCTHFTPVKKSKEHPGMLDLYSVKDEPIRKALKELHYTRAKRIQFEVTLKTINSSKNAPRPHNEKALTGGSCYNLFCTYDNSGIFAKMNGRHCHWSHLIAYHFGINPNNKFNLAPATAASNYYTLKIERHIEAILRDPHNKCEKIDLDVQPYYSKNNKTLIPELIIYKMDWYEKDNQNQKKAHQETHFINPRSDKKISALIEYSIETIRKRF